MSGERNLSPVKDFLAILSPLKPALHQGFSALVKELKEI
jgi:hypothetical protein